MNKKRKTRKRARKEERGTRVGMISIFLVVAALAIVIGLKGRTLQAQDDAYANKVTALTKQLEEQKSRAEELEEKRIYVQTKQYIEEVAKEKLGLVNENEIIFKPSE